VEQAMHLITHCHHRPEWTPAYEYHKAPSRLKLSLRGGSAHALLPSRAPTPRDWEPITLTGNDIWPQHTQVS
jgi:hypothetical protein